MRLMFIARAGGIKVLGLFACSSVAMGCGGEPQRAEVFLGEDDLLPGLNCIGENAISVQERLGSVGYRCYPVGRDGLGAQCHREVPGGCAPPADRIINLKWDTAGTVVAADAQNSLAAACLDATNIQ